MTEKTQFTPQQIQDHREKIDNLCLTAHPDGKIMFESARIIEQLIKHLAVAILDRYEAREHLKEIMA